MSTWWDTVTSWVFWRSSAPPQDDLKGQNDNTPKESQKSEAPGASAVTGDGSDLLSMQPYVFVDNPVEPPGLAGNPRDPTSGKGNQSPPECISTGA
jgi:hypothetical protein